MAESLEAQLVKYLTDVHAIEVQALETLEKAADIVGQPELARIYEEHAEETKEHERLARERLEAHGASPSKLKDMAMKGGAVGTGMMAQAAPDTPGKLAAHSFAFEHFEIASWELLEKVAERAGDTETVEVAERILPQERSAAEKIHSHFDEAVELSLKDQGVSG